MREFGVSRFALERPVTTSMLLLAVSLLGVIGLWRMPLSYLPLVTAPRLEVVVSVGRTSPELLEREVIRPLEEEVAAVRDLERIQVGTGPWGVQMNLDFEPGTDIDARRLELRDRLERARAELPDLVQRIELVSVTNLGEPTLALQLSSQTDLSQDYRLIEDRVLRPLQRVPGVAHVELEGVSPPEMNVMVDLEAARRSGVSLLALGEAVSQSTRGRSMGSLRDDRVEMALRAPGMPLAPERLAELPLQRGASDHFARLGEVAAVSVAPRDDRRGRRLNGRSAVDLQVYAQPGVSAVEVSHRVRARVDEIARDPALDGIELLVFEDQGETILQTLGDLRDAGVYGGALGVLVLLLFLRSPRLTLAAAVSIPLSVLSAAAVLYVQGSALDCVVMLGLVLGVGMLIDNAVVMVEAIAKAAAHGVSAQRAAALGAAEVGFATFASTLSTIIVFLPMATSAPLDEVGAYLRPLGSTFTIVIAASLLVSQTAIPLLMGRGFALSAATPRPSPLFDRVADGYAWLIARTLGRPRLTLCFGLALAGSAAYPIAALDVRLGDAEIQPDNLPLRLEIAGSRSYEVIEGILQRAEAAVLEHREAAGVDDISCSFSDHWGVCRIYPREPFQSENDFEAFQRRVEAILPEQVGVQYRLGELDFDWHENRDRRVVQFVLEGEDMGELMGLSEAVAEHLRAALRETPGAPPLEQVLTPYDDGAEEIHVRLRPESLSRLGLRPDEVAQAVALAFEGERLGSVTTERGELELRLAARPQDAEGAGRALLRDLALSTPTGQIVKLGTVADIETARRPWWIQRVDRQTEVRMSARFATADRDANWAALSAAMEGYAFPPGYTWGRGTQWRREKAASNEMLVNLALCLLLVYAVMASLFESYLQPLGILLTCIIGTFGAPWALWATDTTLDTTAVIGLFVLIGVVVNNGIMLVDKTTQLRAGGLSRSQALQEAGKQRLRPIAMTVSTTLLGLTPMLIHHPTLAGIYYHAVAIVVAGGLATSTLTTLVVLPAAYTVLEGVQQSARAAWRQLGRSRFAILPSR